MAIENICDLRKLLTKAMEDTYTGQISPHQAQAIGDLASEVIITLRVEADYAKILEKKPSIAYLDYSKTSDDNIIDVSPEAEPVVTLQPKRLGK
jgi:hypothetical protein